MLQKYIWNIYFPTKKLKITIVLRLHGVWVCVCVRIICTKNICDVTAWCQAGRRTYRRRSRPAASEPSSSDPYKYATKHGRQARLPRWSPRHVDIPFTGKHTQSYTTMCVQSQSKVQDAWTNIGVVWHIHIAALTPTPTETYDMVADFL